MKVIISHDIDHLTAREHLQDGILLKFWLRNSFELLAGSITPANFGSMLAELRANRWQYIEEILQFDRAHRIPSSFFIGVHPGLGLSYSLADCAAWVKHICQAGFEVGVHGIRFDEGDGIQKEYALFQTVSGLNQFGMRMHYLRMAPNTLHLLAAAGYTYDASLYALKGPFWAGSLVEFPLHLMDVRVFYQQNPYQSVKLAKAQEMTRQIIDQAAAAGLPYFTVLFHDRYFSPAFSKWSDWYIWMVEYCSQQGLEFINYKNACLEFKDTLEL